jgi:hypothetical protein
MCKVYTLYCKVLYSKLLSRNLLDRKQANAIDWVFTLKAQMKSD